MFDRSQNRVFLFFRSSLPFIVQAQRAQLANLRLNWLLHERRAPLSFFFGFSTYLLSRLDWTDYLPDSSQPTGQVWKEIKSVYCIPPLEVTISARMAMYY